ncbi:hypothetical protein J3F83DRAFT_746579 [Trichoderma novae-zelandiae]
MSGRWSSVVGRGTTTACPWRAGDSVGSTRLELDSTIGLDWSGLDWTGLEEGRQRSQAAADQTRATQHLEQNSWSAIIIFSAVASSEGWFVGQRPIASPCSLACLPGSLPCFCVRALCALPVPFACASACCRLFLPCLLACLPACLLGRRFCCNGALILRLDQQRCSNWALGWRPKFRGGGSALIDGGRRWGSGWRMLESCLSVLQVLR